MSSCPCGSGRSLDECCGRYLSGKAQAPTAEALMRARYSAHVTANIDFIERTRARETRDSFDRAGATKWAKDSDWKGLTITSVEGGSEKDTKGTVSFVAAFALEGKEYRHEEVAWFRKDDGAWVFVDGKLPKQEPFVRQGPEVGRNDPCPCGSGKKFKKCHGR